MYAEINNFSFRAYQFIMMVELSSSIKNSKKTNFMEYYLIYSSIHLIN